MIRILEYLTLVFINLSYLYIDFNFTRQNSRNLSVALSEIVTSMPIFIYKCQNQINTEVTEFVNVTKFRDFNYCDNTLAKVGCMHL